MEEFNGYMSKGRDAFVAQDYRKAFEYFNAALEMISDLKDGDDKKQHYYLTQECVFDALEKMQDYKEAIERIDKVIEEEKKKGDSAPIQHIAHFMQRKACLEIKNGNNRPGVKLAGDAFDMSFKTKEQTNCAIAAKIWNEHQRGSKITIQHVDYWQDHHGYWIAGKELKL